MTHSTKRRVLLFFVAGVSVFVVFLSFPRFTASVSYIPVDAALSSHWQDYPIKQRQFPELISIAKKAIGRLDVPRYHEGLGWLYYLQAMSFYPKTDAGQQSLRQAASEFETLLRNSPANPAVWLRLAWIYYDLEEDTAQIVEALNMSMYTGRATRYLMINRLDLVLRHAAQFEAEEVPLIRDQIQLTWRFYPQEMLKHLRSGLFDRAILFNLMAEKNPDLVLEIREKL